MSVRVKSAASPASTMRKRRSRGVRSFGTQFYGSESALVAADVAHMRDAIGSLGQVVGVFVNASVRLSEEHLDAYRLDYLQSRR